MTTRVAIRTIQRVAVMMMSESQMRSIHTTVSCDTMGTELWCSETSGVTGSTSEPLLAASIVAVGLPSARVDSSACDAAPGTNASTTMRAKSAHTSVANVYVTISK